MCKCSLPTINPPVSPSTYTWIIHYLIGKPHVRLMDWTLWHRVGQTTCSWTSPRLKRWWTSRYRCYSFSSMRKLQLVQNTAHILTRKSKSKHITSVLFIFISCLLSSILSTTSCWWHLKHFSSGLTHWSPETIYYIPNTSLFWGRPEISPENHS